MGPTVRGIYSWCIAPVVIGKIGVVFLCLKNKNLVSVQMLLYLDWPLHWKLNLLFPVKFFIFDIFRVKHHTLQNYKMIKSSKLELVLDTVPAPTPPFLELVQFWHKGVHGILVQGAVQVWNNGGGIRNEKNHAI